MSDEDYHRRLQDAIQRFLEEDLPCCPTCGQELPPEGTGDDLSDFEADQVLVPTLDPQNGAQGFEMFPRCQHLFGYRDHAMTRLECLLCSAWGPRTDPEGPTMPTKGNE